MEPNQPSQHSDQNQYSPEQTTSTQQTPPPPPPPEYYYGPSNPNANPQQKSTGLAITSLVMGIVGLMSAWFLIGGLFALVGLITGIISLVKKMGGRGMAIAGIITSSIALLIAATFITLVSFVAYNGVQQRADSSSNQATASYVVKKAEAYNAIMSDTDRSHYPSFETLVSQTEVIEARLGQEYISLISDGRINRASADNPVTYQGCREGAVINYWNPVESDIGDYEVGRPDLCKLSSPIGAPIT